MVILRAVIRHGVVCELEFCPCRALREFRGRNIQSTYGAMAMEPFAVTLTGYIVFFASMIVALGAIMANSLPDEKAPTSRKPYRFVLIASVVVGVVSITNTGGLKAERLRSQHFAQYCQSAHVTVHKTVSGVRDVYFSNGNCLGYLNSGYLSSCETPAYRNDIEPDKPYQREYAGNRVIERIKEPQSEYGVFVKAITTDMDKQLGIGGAEKTITNRRTGEVLATARWYTLTQSAPYPTCPKTTVPYLEMYVLGLGPQETRNRVASEIEQTNREQRRP